MLILNSLEDLCTWRASVQQDVGFVPTMGALHAGHRSLLKQARPQCDCLAVSIFVNPTQFAAGEDLDRYPRTRDADIAALKKEGVDVVWFGQREQIYPAGYCTEVRLPALAQHLCGRSRPQHFAGVAQIVLKLFNLFRPTRAYFGRKDYQQFRILSQMVMDLHLSIEMVPCKIIREASGLAMSSRNIGLDAAGKTAALCLVNALQLANDAFVNGEQQSTSILKAALAPILEQRLVQLEYFELVDATSLQAVEIAKAGQVLAIAARVQQVRLIDNMFLGESL